MLRNFLIIIISIFLVVSNAKAGSDGDLSLKKNEPEKIKDCFEKLNRATFAFNQSIDRAIIKPVAEGYRKLPAPIQKGTKIASLNVLNNNELVKTLPLYASEDIKKVNFFKSLITSINFLIWGDV